MTVPGLDVASQVISLKSVFVEPQLESAFPEIEAGNGGEAVGRQTTKLAAERESKKVPLPEPAIEVLAQQDRLVVLGEPGQGKSTLLRRYAGSLAQSALASSEQFSRVPIVTALGGQREKTKAIEEPYGWLRERVPGELRQALGPNGWAEMCTLLDSNQACVFLDGFDELTREAQQEVRGLAEELKGNQVILSSRPHAYRVLPFGGFTVYRLLDLPEGQIAPFANTLCRIIASAYHLQEFGPALDKVLEVLHGRAAPMARNPLFLSFMCLTAVRKLYEGRLEDFPARPAPLLGECVDALVAWHRTHKASSTWPEDLLGARVLRLLAPLALQSFQDGTGLIKQRSLDEMETENRQTILDHFVSARFIEQRNGEYAFPLETFREYFAALAVAAASDPSADVRKHLHDPAWERVILYTAGTLENPSASRVDLALPNFTPVIKWIDPLAKLAAKFLSGALAKVEPLESTSDVVGTALEMLGPSLQAPLESWLARSRRSTEFYVTAILRHRCRYGQLLYRDLRMAARCLPGLAGCTDRLVRAVVLPLLRLAASSNEVTKRWAIDALREAAAGPQVWKILLRLSAARQASTRCVVANALQGAAANPEVRNRLEQLTSDSENDVRVAASEALRAEAQRREGLRPAAESKPKSGLLSPYLRSAVRPIEPLRPALDAEVFLTLADPSKPGDRQRLLRMTYESDAGGRSKAVDKLARALTVPEVRERVLELTHDTGTEVRKTAASVLDRLAQDPAVRQRLLELTRDANPEVSAAAAKGLQLAAAEASVRERLLDLALDPNEDIRAAAASALGGITGDRQVQRRLRKLLRDSSQSVRLWTLRAMRGWLGAVPRLMLHRIAFIARKNRAKSRLLSMADSLNLRPRDVSSLLNPEDWNLESLLAELEADEATLTLEVLLQSWEQQKDNPKNG